MKKRGLTQRDVLLSAGNVLFYHAWHEAKAANPLGFTFAIQEYRAILEVLGKPRNEWEARYLESNRAAIQKLEALYEENIARDLRVIPH